MLKEFQVKFDERFIHTLVVEAHTEEEAVEKAYKLITDGMSKEMEKEVDYRLDSDGLTGDISVTEY
jgi:hypothetical protein